MRPSGRDLPEPEWAKMLSVVSGLGGAGVDVQQGAGVLPG
jgi:hypothetical protein